MPRSGYPILCSGEREQARFQASPGQAQVDAQAPASTPRCSPSGIRAGQRPVRRRRAAACSSVLEIPDPWRRTVDASLQLIDDLERQIAQINRDLKSLGRRAPIRAAAVDACPGSDGCWRSRSPRRSAISTRFSLGQEAVGYTGLCPRVPPVRREGPPRSADQAGPEVSALGDARVNDARPQAPRLRRALPAQQETPRAPTRRQSRADRHRQESSPRRSGTCSPTTSPSHPLPPREAPLFVWPPDGPFGIAPPGPASHVAWSSPPRRQ